MSFDLMVFEPGAPPPDRVGFLAWCEHQFKWSEEHGYNNPDACTPALRAWFDEMRQTYPAMNGPFASDDYDNPKLSDYSVGQTMIYATFAWSEADRAYAQVFGLARKHRVGFYYVSADDGQVWMPTGNGRYECVHGTSAEPGTVRTYSILATKLVDDDQV